MAADQEALIRAGARGPFHDSAGAAKLAGEGARLHYYKMNIARLPLSTVWSWGNLVSFLFFLLNQKLLRQSLYGTVLVPGEPGVQRLEPSNALPGLEAKASELNVLGFATIGDYTVANLGAPPSRARLFLSSDGRICAIVTAVTTTLATETTLGFISVDPNGQMLTTSTNARPLPLVPGFEPVQRPGATTDALFNLHASRLTGRTVPALSNDDAFDLIQDTQARTLKHYSATGLYELASQADVAGALLAASAPNTAPVR